VPGITDRSTNRALVDTVRLGHGTLECVDIHKTRRFYEEVLGLDIVQTSPRALEVRKGTNHVYVVVETGRTERDQAWHNHNGLDVADNDAVDAAHEAISAVQDEWGLRKVGKPRAAHGDYSFYFQDFDGNWWEVVAAADGGYARDFDGRAGCDLTGHHELEALPGPSHRIHTHDRDFRAALAAATARGTTV
jgi:catechol 2,3-dioxygenase-like lactoylglutathione lyase family enzyme